MLLYQKYSRLAYLIVLKTSFVVSLVGNPEDRFSRDEAHMSLLYWSMLNPSISVSRMNLIVFL